MADDFQSPDKELPGAFEFPYEKLVEKPQVGTNWDPFTFEDQLIFGYFFKNLAVVLFEKAGYVVYPFGYETLIPSLKRKLYDSMPEDTRDRVRTIPDLLLRDPDTGKLTFVEIKSSSVSYECPEPELSIPAVRIGKVTLYKRFWPESVVVLFCPECNYIYGARADDDALEENTLLGTPPWHKAEEFFPRLKTLDEDLRRRIAKKIAVLFQLRREGQI